MSTHEDVQDYCGRQLQKSDDMKTSACCDLLASSGENSGIIPHAEITVLVLCTGNSARSIMAEALFNHLSAGHVCAYSAGSHPAGRVNPYAEEQIVRLGHGTFKARSKSWYEFAAPDAPAIDIVVIVCDNAASGPCPQFGGAPERVHWGLPDPAAVAGEADTIRAAFTTCFDELERRIRRLLKILIQQAPACSSRADVAMVMRTLARETTRSCLDYGVHFNN